MYRDAKGQTDRKTSRQKDGDKHTMKKRKEGTLRDRQRDRETGTQTEINRQRRRPTDESERDLQTVRGRGS